ncbi:MAG: hypothetical protein KC421_04240 [Anaerolineales bacterium]|nr:hypothetical protein [Anaerolineales bacterium]
MAETVPGGLYVTKAGKVVNAKGEPMPGYTFNEKTGKITQPKPAKKEPDKESE